MKQDNNTEAVLDFKKKLSEESGKVLDSVLEGEESSNQDKMLALSWALETAHRIKSL